MKKDESQLSVAAEIIEQSIYIIRGNKVMLDRDLALLYGIETKRLIQAVNRNKERFPEDFAFKLSKEELDFLRFQNGTLDTNPLRSQFVTLKKKIDSKRGKHAKYLPYVFTEQGVAMLSR